MDSFLYWTGYVFWAVVALAALFFVLAILAEVLHAFVRTCSWVAFSYVKAKRHGTKLYWKHLPYEFFRRWGVMLDRSIENIRYKDGTWCGTFKWVIYPKDPR